MHTQTYPSDTNDKDNTTSNSNTAGDSSIADTANAADSATATASKSDGFFVGSTQSLFVFIMNNKVALYNAFLDVDVLQEGLVSVNDWVMVRHAVCSRCMYVCAWIKFMYCMYVCMYVCIYNIINIFPISKHNVCS